MCAVIHWLFAWLLTTPSVALRLFDSRINSSVSHAVKREDFCLTLLHVNDQHDRLLPVNEFSIACKDAERERGSCLGGAAELWGAIETRRAALLAAGKHVLVIDAGDEFQGSPFFTYYKGNLTADVLTSLGWLSMEVFGNHEFDNGPDALASYLRRVAAGPHPFPVRAHNVDVALEPTLNGDEFSSSFYPHGYEIIDIPVITETSTTFKRVALVGVTTELTPENSSPGPNIIFRDSVAALRVLVPKLRNTDHVDHVIVVSHSGVTRDREIARRVPGVDSIIGGHSHSLLVGGILERGPSGKVVPIVQVEAFSKYIGEYELCWPGDGGSLASFNMSKEPTLIAQGAFPEHTVVKSIIDRASGPLEAWESQIVGQVDRNIDGERQNCRTGDCDAGLLVAGAFLDSAFARRRNTSFAIVNGGGVRSGLKRGAVSFSDVLTMTPFQNTVDACTLSGGHVLQVLEHGLSQVEYDATSGTLYYLGGAFPQIAGLTITWNPAAEVGHRVISTVPALETSLSYTIVVHSYLRLGGDGYSSLRNACQDSDDSGPLDVEVVAEFLQRNSPFVVSNLPHGTAYAHGIEVRARSANMGKRPRLRRAVGVVAQGGTPAPFALDASDGVPKVAVATAERAGGQACTTGIARGRVTWGICGVAPGEILATHG